MHLKVRKPKNPQEHPHQWRPSKGTPVERGGEICGDDDFLLLFRDGNSVNRNLFQCHSNL